MTTPIEPLIPSQSAIKIYYATALLSLVFAVVGFSYNAWRLEQSESNSNIRSAAFEILTELSELEQVLYASHYDKNEIEGSPRKGWVKVGMIDDLSMLIDDKVEARSSLLKARWARDWRLVPVEREAVDALVVDIDMVRESVKAKLTDLE